MSALRSRLGSWGLFTVCSHCDAQILLAECPLPDQESNIPIEGVRATYPRDARIPGGSSSAPCDKPARLNGKAVVSGAPRPRRGL
jgi:hypothetical protein